MQDAAKFFKVLADEARLKMLWLLFNHEELCVCDIMEALGITQSKASRHLGTLRHAGLVTDRKDGLWAHYSLRRVEEELARRHIEVLRATLGTRPDAAELLAKLHRWLRAKKRNVVCAKGSMCGGPIAPARTSTRKAARPRRPR